MPGRVPLAGASQFAERVIDRLVFAREFRRQLIRGLIDRNQPLKFPQASGAAGKDLIEVLPHARDPLAIERVATREPFFFKSLRPVGLTDRKSTRLNSSHRT